MGSLGTGSEVLAQHCIKCVRIRSYSGPHFSRISPHSEWIRRDTVSLRIQSECGKIREKCGPEYFGTRTLFTKLKIWKETRPYNSNLLLSLVRLYGYFDLIRYFFGLREEIQESKSMYMGKNIFVATWPKTASICW